MAWSSAIFQQAMLSPIAQKMSGGTAATGATSWGSDTVKMAVYGAITPDKTVTFANSAYAAGVWIVGNEITGTGWAAGGVSLASKTAAIDSGSSSLCFTAANTSNTGVTISGAQGCLIYDASITAGTAANQGLCFNSFGGSQSVTGGTFGVTWATVGATTAVFNITV